MGKHITTEATCRTCGKIFLARQAERKKGNASFCSRSCKALRMSKGKNNGNWKGGISNERIRYANQYKEQYPEQYKATQTVYHAIRRGKLSRKPCEICGKEPAQAHHDDYTKPLEVRWLCIKHHHMLHH